MLARLIITAFAALACLQQASAVIIDSGHVRTGYTTETKLDKVVVESTPGWKTYGPGDHSLTYLGRWDKRHISWWAAPGLKFGFTGEKVAISFGNYTVTGTLVAYRYGGLDWQFTNVTAGATHQFVSDRPFADDLKTITTFEMRVTNWNYGVQIAGVHISPKEKIYKYKPSDRVIEIIGDSLSAGQYASYGGISSWAFGLCEGLGNTECSISAFPGICLTDKPCWGNPRGQTFQWFQTQDGNWRQQQWVGEPEPWPFHRHAAADIVVINLGTNDENPANKVSSTEFVAAYKELIAGVHKTWPKAQIIILSLWIGFYQDGETYKQNGGFVEEIYGVYRYFTEQKAADYLHYFNTTGVLQHNDMGPGTWHPNDLGHLKLAANLMQYIKLKFGWSFESSGPQVFPYPDNQLYNTDCCS